MIEPRRKYPQLLVGEIITGLLGIEWKRTNIRDIESSCDDNYYYMPMIRQINGHNTELTSEIIGFELNEETLFDETKEISVYRDKENYEYKYFQS